MYKIKIKGLTSVYKSML